MDKLELDARVARLERRTTWLSAFAIGCLLLAGIALALMTTARRAISPAAANVVYPAPPVATPSPSAMLPPGQVPSRSVADLTTQLEELKGLKLRGLLDDAQYGAKKKQLLAQPFQPSGLATDLEQLRNLELRQLLDGGEMESFKARVLDSQP